MSGRTKEPIAPADRTRLVRYAAIAVGWTWALWIPALVHAARTGVALPTLDAGARAWAAVPPGTLPFAIMFQLAVYGPLIGAMVTLLLTRDRAALREWARSLVRFRVGWRWWAVVAVWPVALAALVVAISSTVTGSLSKVDLTAGLAGIVPFAVLSQVLTSGMEEPGWRGFALPVLQRYRSVEDANWLLGLLWAAWHVPYVVYLNRAAPVWTIPLTLAGFTMSIVAMTYVHAWVYNATRSVTLNIVLHGWANVTNAAAAAALAASPAAASASGLVTAGLTWLFVAWVLRRHGGERMAPGAAGPEAPVGS